MNQDFTKQLWFTFDRFFLQWKLFSVNINLLQTRKRKSNKRKFVKTKGGPDWRISAALLNYVPLSVTRSEFWQNWRLAATFKVKLETCDPCAIWWDWYTKKTCHKEICTTKLIAKTFHLFFSWMKYDNKKYMTWRWHDRTMPWPGSIVSTWHVLWANKRGT